MSVFPRKSRFRRRHKRCYELSYHTLFDIHYAGNADGVTLVHGTVKSPLDGFPIGHAWLESEDEAYDAVAHQTMPIAQYYAEQGAVAERRYTVQEVNKIFSRGVDHAGPWHEITGCHCGSKYGCEIAIIMIRSLLQRLVEALAHAKVSPEGPGPSKPASGLE